ncbi:MAG: beta galactosidase jelly roll domain-containing protein, partial [Muribaculaceae bacterium]|nr:beta galactosidase jelly roll domain-containing protein [Muribaculaceae bacterium]
MNKFVILIAAISFAAISYSQDKLPAPAISTVWGESVTPENVWSQYPRPMMTRQNWKNLNGEWDYAILPVGSSSPERYDGKILVPFPVESSLSGVGKSVGDKNELWYRRTFTIPAEWKDCNINLNFGGVDWMADIWVNGVYMGKHKGAYSPFSLDITEAVADGENRLEVRVFDPTDKGTQPRGKQVVNPDAAKPKGIWYTPVTGIWQTVWLEPVPVNSITALKITPDVDKMRLYVAASVTGKGVIKVEVIDGVNCVATASGVASGPVEVAMPEDTKLWSTEAPHLYDLKISLIEDGKTTDSVGSYAAMRKVGIKRGKDKVRRFTLNDSTIFHFGPLDQGWWPDGLYTQPSYDAMIYDIDKTKELG